MIARSHCHFTTIPRQRQRQVKTQRIFLARTVRSEQNSCVLYFHIFTTAASSSFLKHTLSIEKLYILTNNRSSSSWHNSFQRVLPFFLLIFSRVHIHVDVPQLLIFLGNYTPLKRKLLEKVLNFLSKKENSLEEYTTIIDITMSVCPPETKYIVFLRNWLSNLDTHF